MSMPSKTRLTRLGERHAAGTLTPSEYDELEEVRSHWATTLPKLRLRIDDLLHETGLSCTGRIKNLGTVAEKIRRERTQLARMRDVVGCRVVVADRIQQERTVQMLIGGLAEFSPQEIDRVAAPMHGYRAIHLAVDVDSVHCEIQVRTVLQHGFAEANERLGDLVGRNLRYGAEPDLTRFDAEAQQAITALLIAMPLLSERINRLEAVGYTLGTALAAAPDDERLASIRSEYDEIHVDTFAGLQAVARSCESLTSLLH